MTRTKNSGLDTKIDCSLLNIIDLDQGIVSNHPDLYTPPTHLTVPIPTEPSPHPPTSSSNPIRRYLPHTITATIAIALPCPPCCPSCCTLLRGQPIRPVPCPALPLLGRTGGGRPFEEMRWACGRWRVSVWLFVGLRLAGSCGSGLWMLHHSRVACVGRARESAGGCFG
jgi:hypothetical protein